MYLPGPRSPEGLNPWPEMGPHPTMCSGLESETPLVSGPQTNVATFLRNVLQTVQETHPAP